MSTRSRDAILRSLRAGSINGRSAPSTDPNDPRGRRGAAAQASTNFQFSLDDFELRDDGTLGLKTLSFLKLLDTPRNYKGSELFFARVNAAGNALEFAPVSGSGGDPGGGGDPSAGGIAGVLTVTNLNSDTTITTNDTMLLCNATSGAFTVTLPTAVGNRGKIFHIKKTDSTGNIVTVDAKNDELIDGDETADITLQYESISIISSNSRWFIY